MEIIDETMPIHENNIFAKRSFKSMLNFYESNLITLSARRKVKHLNMSDKYVYSNRSNKPFLSESEMINEYNKRQNSDLMRKMFG